MPGILRRNLVSLLLYALLITLTIFLFVGGDIQQKHRLVKDLWDSGHLLLFGILSFLYIEQKYLKPATRINQVIVVVAGCFLLGILIEYLQTFADREFSLEDILNNALGGLIGLFAAWLYGHQQYPDIRLVRERKFTLAAMIFLGLVGFRHLEIHLIDELMMQAKFPVIADFENPLELSRWEQKQVLITRTNSSATTGQYALQTRFLPAQYATLSLNHFIGDWSRYKLLGFDIINPSSQVYRMVVKIYDREHYPRGLKVNDRFNKVLKILPGTNNIVIPLEIIRQSPRTRKMDMSRISQFSLFIEQLELPAMFYLDNVRLIDSLSE